jgi:hypothetical protein
VQTALPSPPSSTCASVLVANSPKLTSNRESVHVVDEVDEAKHCHGEALRLGDLREARLGLTGPPAEALRVLLSQNTLCIRVHELLAGMRAGYVGDVRHDALLLLRRLVLRFRRFYFLVSVV